MTERKFRVGLTGIPGAGKSFVASLFASAGIPVYYADLRARQLYYHPQVQQTLRPLLGPDCIAPDGTIHWENIRARLFTSPSLLQQVERILHPLVMKDFQEWERLQLSPVVVMESAILLERKLDPEFDLLLVVYAPQHQARTRFSGGVREFDRRIQYQWTSEQKAQAGDWILLNTETASLVTQIHHILNGMLAQTR